MSTVAGREIELLIIDDIGSPLMNKKIAEDIETFFRDTVIIEPASIKLLDKAEISYLSSGGKQKAQWKRERNKFRR